MDNLITNEMVAGEEFNAISMSDRYVNELLNLNSEQRIEVLINVIGKIHEELSLSYETSIKEAESCNEILLKFKQFVQNLESSPDTNK